MKTLNNGIQIPPIGLGTYTMSGEAGVLALKKAIDIGYRLFDTAFVYGNEETVGQALRDAIADGNVTREELFVVSKLGPTFHRPEVVEKGCRLSLERLGLDYVDLYLMHTPVAAKADDGDGSTAGKSDRRAGFDDDVTPVDTWLALEACNRKGLARSIGVSNFNEAQLREIIEKGEVKPAVNQVECSIGFHQAAMRKFCEKEGILVMAYSPLGKPKPGVEPAFLNSAGLLEMAEKYGQTPAKIALRFLIEIGTIPIPKSSNEARLKENFDVLSFSLDQNDVLKLENLVEQKRSLYLDWLKASKHYPFN